MATIDDIHAFVAAHLSADEVTNLTGWLALRADRAASLLGATDEARLRRALEWATEDQRVALLAWLERRRVDGRSYRPGYGGRPGRRS